MKRIRNKIGRNLETEIPVSLAVLKVLYDNDMIFSANPPDFHYPKMSSAKHKKRWNHAGFQRFA